jgi:hypothetical protein
MHKALIDRSLEAVSLLLRLVLGEGDGHVADVSLESQGVKALLQGLEDVFEDLGADVVHLVETFHSVLDDLGN